MSFLLLDSTLWIGCICCCCLRLGWIYDVVAMDLIKVIPATNWSHYVVDTMYW